MGLGLAQVMFSWDMLRDAVGLFRRAAPVPCHEAGGRHEVRAGALPAGHHATVATEGLAVLLEPPEGVVGVVERRRERVLWREAVVEGDHRQPCPSRKAGAGDVDVVQAPADEAASVQPEQQRPWVVGTFRYRRTRTGPSGSGRSTSARTLTGSGDPASSGSGRLARLSTRSS